MQLELELCSIQEQTDEDIKAGRVGITMSCLEISKSLDISSYNRNGIHWEKQNVLNNLESANGMPFVVRFLDDERSIISDHGRMENDLEDGNIIFPDSDTVGYVEKSSIEETVVDRETKEVVLVKGYIFDQRYHELVKFLRDALAKGEHIKGSVEISGKGKSKQIVYEHGMGSKDANGNLIIGRSPKIFDFSAICILNTFVQEADSASEVIEINALNNQSTDNKSDDIEQENNSKEDKIKMDELNTKIAELNAKIAELNATVSEKDTEINRYKEELNSSKAKETELNTLLVDVNKSVELQKNQIAELNTEIEPLRQLKTEVDKEKAQSEVNMYFETVKSEDGFSEAELNSLKSDFVDKCDLEGLKAKEQELCISKFKELRKIELAASELNTKKTDETNTLFFSTKIETVETNSTDVGAELFK